MNFSCNAWMDPAVWLVSRLLAERAGPWNEGLLLNDDGEYFCRVVAQSGGVRFVREAWSYYRQRQTGSLSRHRPREAAKVFRLLNSGLLPSGSPLLNLCSPLPLWRAVGGRG